MNDLTLLPRKAILVLLAIGTSGREGAAYSGLRWALGMRSESGIRSAVKCARDLGLVDIVHTGGRCGRSLIYLTDSAKALLRTIRERKADLGHPDRAD